MGGRMQNPNCSACTLCRAMNARIDGSEAYMESGQRMEAGFPFRPGPGSVLSRWYQIQQSLLAQQPEDGVELGSKLLRFDDEGDHVSLVFEGREDPVRASVLVAADGINSAVKLQLLGHGGGFDGVHWEQLGFTEPDSVILRGVVPADRLAGVLSNPTGAAPPESHAPPRCRAPGLSLS